MKSLNFQLHKTGSQTPWGFRIQGGRDFNRPLLISRITCDSVANKLGLKCGDQITRIGSQVTAFMSHNEAQQWIIDSGENLTIEIQRASSPTNEPRNSNGPNVFHAQNFIMERKPTSATPRTGLGTDIQISHSNFDLKYRSPVCSLCNVEIRGPFIIVLDSCFCPNHFICYYCQNDLTKRNFLELNGMFYCEEDYSKFVAPNCRHCGNPIVGNEVTAMGAKWHTFCFNCNRCGCSLQEESFKIGDDKLPYCEPDWNELFLPKCNRCHQFISVLDQFVEISSITYHAKCFCCSACNVPLVGKPFHNRDGKPFCRIHAHATVLF